MVSQYKKKPPQKRWKRILKRIVLGLLLAVLLGLLGWYGYATLSAKYRRTFTGYTVQTGDIVETNEYSGNMALKDSATYTAPSAATVRKVYHAAGETVSKGENLIRLSDGTTLTADFDGKINTVKVAEGDEVAAGDTLLTLADFTHLQISIRVDEYDVTALSVGKECTVTVTATGETFTAQVSSIDYTSGMGMDVAYYTVVLEVEVGDTIYPGMQVTVTFTETLASNTTLVQKDALSFDEKNSAYVWKKDDSGNPVQVYVEIGVYNDDQVQILSGAESGEVVYVEDENTTTAATGLFSMFSSVTGGGNSFSMAGGGNQTHGNRDGSGFGGGSMPSGGGGKMPSGGGMPGQ